MLITLLNFLSSNFLFFALHFDNTSVFPKPLSAKEERECFEKMADGDKGARDKLIEHNLRLVAHIIKKYYSAASEQDDLISIGTIGLIKAVSTFDYKKGCRFATYGSRCVENEILMHFRALKKSASDMYFDEPVESDKDGNSLRLIDIISDGADLGDKIELMIKSEQLYKFITEYLDDRERQIISMRYGLYNGIPLTQREVAAKLDISRSYVSRIEKKALQTLRKKYESG
ncbi:RNA polymerase sporulation sigma factor SigK [uncultured Ruminococcus sp.]|uniref:RNA polymerase sporulation sigma factor SigK n=1 Tax=uncultured Ruminococcus sp. TaxID=165186 RepID=UPI0025EDBEF2|nr:RNA polymerase sporulation sigma factor SigK [uncultured Ruminococcus sp.]